MGGPLDGNTRGSDLIWRPPDETVAIVRLDDAASSTGSATQLQLASAVNVAAGPLATAPFRLTGSPAGRVATGISVTDSGYGVAVLFADPDRPGSSDVQVSGRPPCPEVGTSDSGSITEQIVSEETIGGAAYCLIVQEDVTVLQRRDPAGPGPFPPAVADLPLTQSHEALAALLDTVELAPDLTDRATWFDLTY